MENIQIWTEGLYMAIIDPWNLPIDINSYDYAIKGNMIKYQLSISEVELMKIDPKNF